MKENKIRSDVHPSITYGGGKTSAILIKPAIYKGFTVQFASSGVMLACSTLEELVQFIDTYMASRMEYFENRDTDEIQEIDER